MEKIVFKVKVPDGFADKFNHGSKLFGFLAKN
jgi:hypothetical protein